MTMKTGEAFRLIIQITPQKAGIGKKAVSLNIQAGIPVEQPDAQFSALLEQVIKTTQTILDHSLSHISPTFCHLTQAVHGQAFVLFGLRYTAVVQESGPSIFSGEVVIDPEMAKLDDGRIAVVAQECLDKTMPALFEAYECWPYELL
ncbi:MAG: hypothetical protein LBV40_00265 [Methanomicrobiales archaeon]|nr:hypothetical protein [Methanomicrobiales archaeon]